MKTGNLIQFLNSGDTVPINSAYFELGFLLVWVYLNNAIFSGFQVSTSFFLYLLAGNHILFRVFMNSIS